jgi:hypothetical protein
MHSNPRDWGRLRLVTEHKTGASAPHVAPSAPTALRFAVCPPLDATETEAEVRSGRMTAAILIGCVVAAITLGGYFVARWSMPDTSVPCGKTVELHNGLSAFVVCDDDEAPRGDTP